MKPLAFVLLALVGSLVLTNLPASYADPNLDTLLRIATQARDNINIQLSQLPSVPVEINQLYNQGSGETDALAQSVSQGDQGSAKTHFLSAMRIFKSVNDKISSLTPATTSGTSQIDTSQLKDDINRIQNLGNRLKTIATNNNVEIDFTKFDALMQDARQNLDAGNVDQVNKDLVNANQFLLDAHHALADAATKKTTDRAKNFTVKEIQKLSQAPNSVQNVTQSSTPLATPPSEITNATLTGNVNDMIVKLRQLVSEGKIDEALKLIKLIDAIQNQKTSTPIPRTESSNAQPTNVNNVNATENANPINNSSTPTNIASPTNNSTTPTNTTSPPTKHKNTTSHTPPSNVPAKTNSITNSVTTPIVSRIFLTVNLVDQSGNPVTGIWNELHSPDGTTIAIGYSPNSYSVTPGNQYGVYVSNWHNTVFNHWDNGSTNPDRIITPTQNTTLTAYYSTSTTHGDHEKHQRED